MKILSGTSNTQLAHSIAHHLNSEPISVEISKFSNGEKRVWIPEKVSGKNVAIVQSLSQPVDEYIIELLLLTDALERAGARHVNAIIPWMGYSLQDKVFRPGEPIAAKVVANLISNAYIKRVQLLDLHNTSIPGFFYIPSQHLSALDLFAQYVKDSFSLENAVVVSPDFGGLKRARIFADSLDLDLANIDKYRDLQTGKVTPLGLSGNVSNKICFVFDDVINTGSTLKETAQFLKSNGAKEVHFISTHALFAGNALEEVKDNSIDSIIITNSVHHENLEPKIKVLDVAPLFAEAIRVWE